MLRCAGCKNSIKGRYLKAMGRNWHPACFTCDLCSARLSGEYHKEKGQKLCPSCYAQTAAPRCSACGKPVLGQFVTALGGTWHSECLKCSVCGKTLAGEKFHEHLSKPVCQKCYDDQYAPHCDVCGRTLNGHYRVDLWGNKYCSAHEKNPGMCDFCGRIISRQTSKGGGRRKDGVDVCGLCAETGISKAGVVESLARMVRQFFAKRGLGLEASMPLKLVSRPDMPADQLGQDRLGVIVKKVRTRGNKVIGREVEAIYLLDAMPAEKLCEVIAHEYGHAWLFFNGYPELPSLAEEGIAQLFAHIWLTERGTVLSSMLKRMVEENEDKTYGDGVRRALKGMNRLGLFELLAYVKTHNRLP